MELMLSLPNPMFTYILDFSLARLRSRWQAVGMMGRHDNIG
jgi:hypothetical protein